MTLELLSFNNPQAERSPPRNSPDEQVEPHRTLASSPITYSLCIISSTPVLYLTLLGPIVAPSAALIMHEGFRLNLRGRGLGRRDEGKARNAVPNVGVPLPPPLISAVTGGYCGNVISSKMLACRSCSLSHQFQSCHRMRGFAARGGKRNLWSHQRFGKPFLLHTIYASEPYSESVWSYSEAFLDSNLLIYCGLDSFTNLPAVQWPSPRI